MIYVFPLGNVADVVHETEATLSDYGYDLSVVFGSLMSVIAGHAHSPQVLTEDMFTYLIENAQYEMETELFTFLSNDTPHLDESDKDILVERILTAIKFLAAEMVDLCYDVYKHADQGRMVTFHSMFGNYVFLEIG